MVTCARCESELPDKARYCPHCGEPVQASADIKIHQEVAQIKDEGKVIGVQAESIYGDIHITGERARDRELAYLDGLLMQYEHWRDHYTPLAGIAEVRAALEDGPRLDLPMPVIPPEFEKLVEHGYGPRTEVRREPVGDIREAVAKHKRILLLGEPGSGKTTTLRRLAYDYANAAREDADQPLPVYVKLGEYTDDGPFEMYLGHHLGPLAPYLNNYRAAGRLLLLLDGLNEMPQAGYRRRLGRIQELLDQREDETAIVTCRTLDYVVALKGLQRVEVSPFDVQRIRSFLHHCLGDTAGERLFWTMAGGEISALWETWSQAGGKWNEFWHAERMSLKVWAWLSATQRQLWANLRQELPPLLALGRNPYMLLMTAWVYAGAGGTLPTNQGQLFAAFVDTLLRRVEERRPEDWIETKHQKEGLAGLAYAIQDERGRGTTVEREWALGRLRTMGLDCDVERLLYLASSAMLLETDAASVTFRHELLQEYFAALELGRRVGEGESLDRYWPQGEWWKPSGWEETTILLAGMEAHASALLEHLAPVNPVLAARCLIEGSAQASDAVRAAITTELLAGATESEFPPAARAQAGVRLAHVGDPRDFDELVTVPAGPFLKGSSDADEMALAWEKPQREVTLPTFKIGKYPVTNSQYRAFVEARGYDDSSYWTIPGWDQKGLEGWTEPDDYGEPFNLPNHPVVGVSGYEAVAYCLWLTEVWQWSGRIGPNEVVRLPTEEEWEKAARGTDGRRYPWGDEPDPNRANYDEAGLGTTSAVGCFPTGASPYGCLEMAGNVLEWTWFGIVLRGGAFYDKEDSLRCAARSRVDPNMRSEGYGFRIVVSSVSPAL